MHLIHTLLLLFLATGLSAQTTLKGKVTDNNNTSIPFAAVALIQQDSTIQGTLTDLDGNYIFSNLKAGVYTLELSYTGYSTSKLTKITVEEGKVNTVNTTMSPATNLEEVVVTAYRVPLIDQDNCTQGSALSLSHVDTRSARKHKRRAKAARKESNNRGSRVNTTYYANNSRTHRKKTDPASDREQYNKIKENDFIETKKENISTISTDVDRAAYANIRGLINAGQEVPKDAVRIEEMINYFPYQEKRPTDNDPVAVTSELTECPWNPDHQLLRVAVQAKGMHLEQAPASNVVFLVDVSGSMADANKLPLVTKGLQMLASNLRQQDRVAIVAYAGAAGLVLPSTSGADQITILTALTKLKAGGSTAGGQGIELAYKVATDNFIKGGNNRVILVTDGDFNVGIREQDKLVSLIEKKRESGVFLTVIGCGRGNYQDGKMQELADRGNGNHGYLDSYAEARKLLVDEFGGTVYTVAKDVKLQLEFNSQTVKSYRLIGYENRLLNTEDFDDDTKDAAELGAGHQVTVLYEIDLNKHKKETIGELRLRYKKPDENQSKKMVWSLSSKLLPYQKASNNFQWSAAVAEFGMLLRDSKHKGHASLLSCKQRAEAALGPDPFGYRKEMVSLIDKLSKK